MGTTGKAKKMAKAMETWLREGRTTSGLVRGQEKGQEGSVKGMRCKEGKGKEG